MSKIALEGQLSETVGTVTVSASPDAGGQLVTGVTNAYDVTICVTVAPVRLKWRIGTSGDWRETEGGECFTVSGGDAQSLYLAKQSAQSASVFATYTVRQLTSVSAAGLTVPIVTYSQTPAGGVEKLSGVVGVKVGRFAPITPISLTVASDAPTITNSTTSTIAGGVSVGRDDPALTYYTHAGIGDFQGWLNYNGTGRQTQIEWMTNSQVLEFGIIHFNTSLRFFVDGKLASAHLTTSSSGAEIYYKLSFPDRRPRRITAVGVNMPFQRLVLSAGDAIWPAPDDVPVACIAGDSYTFGSGGVGGPALSWAMLCGFSLGLRVIPDGVGGSGWQTTGADSILTRLNTTGANVLTKRVGGVNSLIKPDLHMVAFGHNDAGGDMAVVSSVATQYVAASNVKPIMVGPWTPAGENANLIAVKNALSSVAASASVHFIDISTFIAAANKASLIDVDNVHPVLTGHDYLNVRIASELRARALA